MNVLPLFPEEEKPLEIISFDDFWLLYPRKAAKKDASKAWLKLDANQKMAACTALVEWRKIFMQKDPEFVPYPATWLNGERWEDELPSDWKRAPTAIAHKEFKPSAEPEKRAPMPDKLREMLARLRQK